MLKLNLNSTFLLAIFLLIPVSVVNGQIGFDKLPSKVSAIFENASATLSHRGEANLFEGIIQNPAVFPNPFSDITTISYQLLKDSKVEISILNILGQEILTLTSEYQNAGKYSVSWKGTNANGKNLQPGIFYVIMNAGNEKHVLKIMKSE